MTEAGRRDPLFEGLPDTLPVFHLHGETVALPPQATLLGSSEAVPNQIIRVGANAYGTQGHFELTHQLLEEWLRVDPDLLNLGHKGVEQVRKDFGHLQEQYTQVARRMFTNFLNLVE